LSVTESGGCGQKDDSSIAVLAAAEGGGRESGAARLEEAVAAYREALQEYTHVRVPLQWAATKHSLGVALSQLGERESGTARLDEAVAAYREALEERTRARVPLKWAATQMSLGNALGGLGERESGTAKLEEAVAAYREALQEDTRARVPLDWAMTHNNLNDVFTALGERERGTARLTEAIAACRAALEERPANACRSNGPRPRTISEMHSECSASGRAGRRGSTRLSPPFEAGATHLEKTPNITTLPDFGPFGDNAVAHALLKAGDDISADDIIPAGTRVLPYWSNIPKVAEFAFESVDGTYAKRAKESRDRGERHIIVAGSNYGQGSSRENAAVAARFLGLQVVTSSPKASRASIGKISSTSGSCR
jgi:tetratricopeptide (TPR) repeat protein